MIKTTQHTPRPWEVIKIGHKVYIQTVTGKPKTRFVCDMNSSETLTPQEQEGRIATAEFIVRACNAHEDLLTVCKAKVIFREARNSRRRMAIAKAEGTDIETGGHCHT